MKTLSEDRRALHRIPETGCRLPETAAYLRGALAEMPCTLLAPWEDAVCAYFDLGKDETVAVRSDMDALPVTERTGLPFASAHPGRMHACGHDGHMAMVLGLARRLAAGEVRPQRNVLLIFEPAEETTGGAAPICATGLLERYHVTRVFGMHLWPELPAGVIASRAGAMMSRSCELTVEITGRSVHLARFAEGCDALDAAAGSVSQVKDCTLSLMQVAKGQGITVFVIGHVNKEGSIAGPKVLEHMVDCVLYFEGDQHTSYRILRAAKNRFGATNEIGVFEMRDEGLAEVENPSEMLLSGRPEDAPGTCVTCVMEGVRPVLAELQALVVSSAGGNPRRTSNGFDYNRAAMLLAVLEKRGGLKVSACDAYLNIVGGLSLDEPAADLAAVIALASSYLDRPVPSDLVAIGEVGLTGELRSVNQLGQRVSEIQRLGFRRCVVPAHRAGTIKAPTGLTVIPARNIGEAIRAALRPAE